MQCLVCLVNPVIKCRFCKESLCTEHFKENTKRLGIRNHPSFTSTNDNDLTWDCGCHPNRKTRKKILTSR